MDLTVGVLIYGAGSLFKPLHLIPLLGTLYFTSLSSANVGMEGTLSKTLSSTVRTDLCSTKR